MQQWQGECGSLPSSGLRLADDVMASQNLRDHPLLNRSGFRITILGQRIEKWLAKAEIRKSRAHRIRESFICHDSIYIEVTARMGEKLFTDHVATHASE